MLKYSVLFGPDNFKLHDPSTGPNPFSVKILICPDKFKGSLDAKQVCIAIERGLWQIDPDFLLESIPLADGGEGTCDLLTEWHEGSRIDIQVNGPLFSPVTAHYGLSKNGDTAFMEMAVASGLTLLEPEMRNPLFTTSFGTGEMIADAVRRGAKTIVLGLGGSATNDAGMGMAAALGYEFCDVDGEVLNPMGENLIHLRHIKRTSVNPLLPQTTIIALCDVMNPLVGPEGAAYIYGPQKGASKSDVELLDAGLRNFRRVVHNHLKISVDFPGAGAAGGLGAGAKVFLNATMEKGVSFVIRNTNLEDKIKQADLVITGEGKIDGQTFSGKVISEVIRLGQQSGKPVVAICGICDVPETDTKAYGLEKVISLVNRETSPQSAIQHAAELVTCKISEAFKDVGKP